MVFQCRPGLYSPGLQLGIFAFVAVAFEEIDDREHSSLKHMWRHWRDRWRLFSHNCAFCGNFVTTI
jgi:hypothetical protein